MDTWKKVPSWFNLENYRQSFNFTAKDWLEEIEQRLIFKSMLAIPEFYSDDHFNAKRESALQFFEDLKKHPLISTYEISDSKFQQMHSMSKYKHIFYSVQDLSEFQAYEFFMLLDNKAEFEKDYLTHFNWVFSNREDWIEGVKDRLEFRNKYSQPIANHEIHGNEKFLKIDLDASDEQIISEFKKWLIDNRSASEKFIKHQLLTKDFQDWADSQLLPYWDLTTTAAIENASIPYHVLGNALFPDEYGVDLTERIRKITKKKCQYMFSREVSGALLAQAGSEKLNRNNSL